MPPHSEPGLGHALSVDEQSSTHVRDARFRRFGLAFQVAGQSCTADGLYALTTPTPAMQTVAPFGACTEYAVFGNSGREAFESLGLWIPDVYVRGICQPKPSGASTMAMTEEGQAAFAAQRENLLDIVLDKLQKANKLPNIPCTLRCAQTTIYSRIIYVARLNRREHSIDAIQGAVGPGLPRV
eukprot:361880-Chlamydomonas_euryale.AAC.16